MGFPDPMLLTLPTPAKTEFEFKSPHDFLPQPPLLSRLTSPKSESSAIISSLPTGSVSNMTTPHRGLPPPAPSSMTLPDPGRLPPPIPSAHQSLSNLPAPPSQWQATDESMRNWLVTKAEEERRKQEEEKTRQESLRLEQRKVEQSMLQESIRSGIPPSLVPMIFVGIGGANLPGLGLEWLQQYTAQLAHQQQTQAVSPDARRNERLLPQSQQPPYPPVPPAAQGQPGQYAPPYPPPPPVAGSPTVGSRTSLGSAAGPTSAPRSQFGNPLPRLSTTEMHIPPPPPPPPGSGQPPSHAQTATPAAQSVQQQQEQQSSPSIYFHHWVPPSTQSGSERASGGGGTTGGATAAGGSSSANPASSSTPAEYSNSPKKRKATGAHQAAPPPPAATHHHHRYSSPSVVSTPGRRGHTRQRSDVSSTTRGRGGSTGSHDAQSLQQNPPQPSQQGWALPNVAESTGQGHADPNHPSSNQHHQHQHHHHQSQRSRPEEPGDGGGGGGGGYGSPRMSTRRSGGHSQHASSGRSSAVTSPPEGGQATSSRGEGEY